MTPSTLLSLAVKNSAWLPIAPPPSHPIKPAVPGTTAAPPAAPTGLLSAPYQPTTPGIDKPAPRPQLTPVSARTSNGFVPGGGSVLQEPHPTGYAKSTNNVDGFPTVDRFGVPDRLEQLGSSKPPPILRQHNQPTATNDTTLLTSHTKPESPVTTVEDTYQRADPLGRPIREVGALAPKGYTDVGPRGPIDVARGIYNGIDEAASPLLPNIPLPGGGSYRTDLSDALLTFPAARGAKWLGGRLGSAFGLGGAAAVEGTGAAGLAGATGAAAAPAVAGTVVPAAPSLGKSLLSTAYNVAAYPTGVKALELLPRMAVNIAKGQGKGLGGNALRMIPATQAPGLAQSLAEHAQYGPLRTEEDLLKQRTEDPLGAALSGNTAGSSLSQGAFDNLTRTAFGPFKDMRSLLKGEGISPEGTLATARQGLRNVGTISEAIKQNPRAAFNRMGEGLRVEGNSLLAKHIDPTDMSNPAVQLETLNKDRQGLAAEYRKAVETGTLSPEVEQSFQDRFAALSGRAATIDHPSKGGVGASSWYSNRVNEDKVKDWLAANQGNPDATRVADTTLQGLKTHSVTQDMRRALAGRDPGAQVVDYPTKYDIAHGTALTGGSDPWGHTPANAAFAKEKFEAAKAKSLPNLVDVLNKQVATPPEGGAASLGGDTSAAGEIANGALLSSSLNKNKINPESGTGAATVSTPKVDSGPAGVKDPAPGAPGGHLAPVVLDSSRPKEELDSSRQNVQAAIAGPGGVAAAIGLATQAEPPSGFSQYWKSLEPTSKVLAIAGVSMVGISLLRSMFKHEKDGDEEEDESFLMKALPFIGIGAAAWGVGGGTLSSLPKLEKYKELGNAVAGSFNGLLSK